MRPRRSLIAGNWKMNGSLAASAAFGRDLADWLAKTAYQAADILICPPFPYLIPLQTALAGQGVSVGAQNCHANLSGAHTGDVSPSQLADCGASYVILGHSERRQDHQETSAGVKAKAETALKAGLSVIICVGETLAERDAGQAVAVVRDQLLASLPNSFTESSVILAYEPIWAIGTGRTASLADIAEMHAALRAALPDGLQKGVRILYGGSVKPQNAVEILALSDVDGALVGGASLTVPDFTAILAGVSV
jgi:triosephosphate isomerase (TIM)